MSFRLLRSHRLKRRRLIRPLFSREAKGGGSVAVGCIRIAYRIVPREAAGVAVPVQVGFSPGRKIRKAVARNRIKRLLREVYRVHQRLLVDLFVSREEMLTLMILFRGTEAQAKACIIKDLPDAMRLLARRCVPPPERS